jgi:hypothetical protein
MLWLCIAAAGAGALLGLLGLRVLAVLAGSVVLVVITVALAAFGHWPLLEAVINAFLLLAIFQFTYLAASIYSVCGSASTQLRRPLRLILV